MPYFNAYAETRRIVIMRRRVLAFGIIGTLWAASLAGQRRRMSWQDACFNHPTARFCAGREFAVKPPPRGKNARAGKGATAGDPSGFEPEIETPSVIVMGAIDWRFADPLADVLVGINASSLAAWPAARNVIARLGAKHGLTETDLNKIFEGLTGLSRIGLSVHDDRIVVMITGVGDSTFPALEAGWKSVPVGRNTMLVGHADAVELAVQRIEVEEPPADRTRLGEGWQADGECWAMGSGGLAGPQAVSAGMKRFLLTVATRERISSNVALEFDGVPDANTLKLWPATLGGATIEGHMVHVRISMEGDELQQRLDEIAASPLARRLAALVGAARYLPGRPRVTKPTI